MKSGPSPSTLFTISAPADLGPGPRAGVLSDKSIRAKAAEACPGSDEFLALALLFHDHHEAAHELVQAGENRDASYVHAILHRREPDFWNSKYWFRRVGRHPIFVALGRAAAGRLQPRGRATLAATLAPGGEWDPLAFVDACAASAAARATDAPLLTEIQQIEFELLAAHLIASRKG